MVRTCKTDYSHRHKLHSSASVAVLLTVLLSQSAFCWLIASFLFLKLRLGNTCTVQCAEDHRLQSKSLLVMSCLRAVETKSSTDKRQNAGMHAAASRTQFCCQTEGVSTTSCASVTKMSVSILTMQKL